MRSACLELEVQVDCEVYAACPRYDEKAYVNIRHVWLGSVDVLDMLETSDVDDLSDQLLETEPDPVEAL